MSPTFQPAARRATNVPTTFTLSLDGAPAGTRADGTNEPLVVPAQGSAVHPFVVSIDRDHYVGKAKFDLVIKSEPGGTVLKRTISFAGPDAELLREDQEAEKLQPSAPREHSFTNVLGSGLS